jgi:hypothetical protein
MKHALDWDLIETRETIRQAAYDIASSGACDGWQDVWRFLRTTFGVEQLVDIFWNPLCQMDLDQRCSRARSSGKVLPNDEKSDPSEISRKTSLEIATTKHPDSDRQMQTTGRMAKQIHALLADGRECTATEIAEALDASCNKVLIALREMLAAETLQVSRYISVNGSGRRARVFVRTDVAALKKRDEIGPSTPWPQEDSALTAVIDAIARRR